MGAARHIQRHQEQAHRRIARSEPVQGMDWHGPSGRIAVQAINAAREAYMREKAHRRVTRSEPVAQRDEVIAEWTRIALDAQAERDRLQAALDSVEHYAKASRDDFAKHRMKNRAAEDILAILANHGIGGES